MPSRDLFKWTNEQFNVLSDGADAARFDLIVPMWIEGRVNSRDVENLVKIIDPAELHTHSYETRHETPGQHARRTSKADAWYVLQEVMEFCTDNDVSQPSARLSVFLALMNKLRDFPSLNLLADAVRNDVSADTETKPQQSRQRPVDGIERLFDRWCEGELTRLDMQRRIFAEMTDIKKKIADTNGNTLDGKISSLAERIRLEAFVGMIYATAGFCDSRDLSDPKRRRQVRSSMERFGCPVDDRTR